MMAAAMDAIANLDLDEILATIATTYGRFFHDLNGVDPAKHARDALDPAKVEEKLAVFARFSGPLAGKRLLEVGSGFGMLVATSRLRHGALSYGIEPSGAGYEGSLAISRRLLTRAGLEPAFIIEGVGEAMPFATASFDLVYSTNVLEHVRDPEMVLRESARVLKPGGIAQIVVPNYGSFWEGHYGVFWPPYAPRWLGRLIVRAFGRDPSFVDTLTLVTQRELRRIMRAMAPEVEVLDWGEGLFHQRLTGGRFSTWAALGRVKRAADLVRRLRLAHAASWVLRKADAIAPVVLSFRRR